MTHRGDALIAKLQCQLFGAWGLHYCPALNGQQSDSGAPIVQLTEEAIRRIVRDELDRKFPAVDWNRTMITGTEVKP